MKTFWGFLLIFISLNLNEQSIQKRIGSIEKLFTLFPMKRAPLFHFWTDVSNDSPSTLELKIKFPTIISIESKESYA